MDKITFLDVIQFDGSTETFAIIDRGNNEFTSMTKEIYDAQLASNTLPSNSSTPQAGA